jgi:hypothetical protein
MGSNVYGTPPNLPGYIPMVSPEHQQAVWDTPGAKVFPDSLREEAIARPPLKGSRGAKEGSFSETTRATTSDPVNEAKLMTREEMDAKLATTEARVDKTLAEIRAEFASDRAEMANFRGQIATEIAALRTQTTTEIAGLRTEISHLPSTKFLIGTAITIIAAVLGALSYGSGEFGNGIMVTTSSIDRANEALEVSRQNQEEITTISTDLREVLQELRQLRAAPPATPPAASE